MPPSDKTEQKELVDALDSAGLHLVFAWRKKPDDWYAELVPTMDALTNRFLELAKNTATDLLENRTETTYAPDYPLNETQFFAIPNPRQGDPASAPVGGNLFPKVDDFGQLPDYGSSRRRSNPNAYLVVAQLPDGSVAKFGRRVSASQLLKSSRWIRAFWTGETFDLLEEGPVLALDPFFDWIEWRDMVIVLSANAFHGVFRTLPQLQQAVAGHVQTITAKITVQNDAEFIARCQSSPSMASKLESIVDQKLYEKPVADLKNYSNRFPELGVTWAGDALVFDGSLERQWSILRLLDEAGFTGELSGEKFEAPAKRHL